MACKHGGRLEEEEKRVEWDGKVIIASGAHIAGQLSNPHHLPVYLNYKKSIAQEIYKYLDTIAICSRTGPSFSKITITG